MSERKPTLILSEIIKCIDHVEQYTLNISADGFAQHFMAAEACLYNLQVIGEAVSQLPLNIKNTNEHIPWAMIKGMRNRLIHQYFGTDLAIVWFVIKNELPIFKEQVLVLIKELQ